MMVSELIALCVLTVYQVNMILLCKLLFFIHPVENLHLFIENADYMVKENIGSFVAAVVASRAADFDYTVTVDTSDGTAVGT